jgi:Rps23 Pro-64 3,4-dihydroxylase Tpa1-like proline 4-hydroxylase
MLNQNLDDAHLARLAAEFTAKQRIQVQHILQPEAAQLLYQCLHQQVPWTLAYIDGEESTTLSSQRLAAMMADERKALKHRVHARALEKFQFLYNSYMMIKAYQERQDPELILHRVTEYLNTPEYIGFIKAITGVRNIIKADAQATRYIPGHFLKRHDDIGPKEGRELAYVLNLTRGWQADWGGLLHFLDEDDQVIDTFVPHYNSLSLFRVPAWHCVSMVSPYALQARYSITGWLRSD